MSFVINDLQKSIKIKSYYTLWRTRKNVSSLNKDFGVIDFWKIGLSVHKTHSLKFMERTLGDLRLPLLNIHRTFFFREKPRFTKLVRKGIETKHKYE